MALLIIFLLLCLASIVYYIVRLVQFKKARDITVLKKPFTYELIGLNLIFAISSVLAGIGIKIKNNYAFDGLHYFYLIFGAFLFGVSIFSLLESFTLYFYKPELDIKTRKILKIIMLSSILPAIAFFFMSTESYVPYLEAGKGLISGFNISSKGICWVYGDEVASSGFTIKWYALIILTGAFATYSIVDHKLYKEYNRHGIVDTMFIVCLLTGILGARIWYCAVLEHNMSIFFEFQNGGLGVMGGVILGGICGILFVIFFLRYINLRHMMDIVLPAVLIAQAIGRWGNFFNQEVYGYMTLTTAQAWWMPGIIRYNMTIDGAIHLPLFLIESITNLTGYFIITKAYGELLKNHKSHADEFFLYVSWYGLTRVIMEPLRAGTFQYNMSYIFAWIMFGVGFASIVGLHIYDYLRWGKHTFNYSKNNFTNPKCPYYIKKIENNNESTNVVC